MRVSLRRPVPTEHDLTIASVHAGGAQLRVGETLLAEATSAQLQIEVPAVPSLGEAIAASERYPGHHGHPFGECFACGPDRAEGDGLRVFPGAVDDRPLLAAPWTPPDEADGQPVGLELIWSTFDCAQLWALMVQEPSLDLQREA